jgi:hypothetical protein
MPQNDEWRVEVRLEDEEHHYQLADRVQSLDLDEDARKRLGGSVTITRDVRLTRWHPIEEAWRDASEPLPQTKEEREAERARHEAAEAQELAKEGEYDYEVHVDPPHHREAVELDKRLREEGLGVKRRWKHITVGALTEEDANELAERVQALAPEGTEVTIGATDFQHPLFVFFGSARDRLR